MTNDPTELASTKIDVAELLDTPGATREVELDLPVPEGFEVPLTAFGDEVRVDGVLESLVDGVLLRGTVEIDVDQQCAMCLESIDRHPSTADVAELFSDPATAEDPEDVEVGYTIRGGVIDIDTLIRDALAADIDTAPHCRPDCKGLCPTCGINRNEATCDCHDTVVDDRWSALADLDLDS
ncbi:DUF177 domain-containing protein [Euzebya pacifica]|uniref:YceD family protein n=1 Tax=Euzebya pacifica TaxID=1608957 RepID=UPI0030FCBF19